MSDQSVYKGKTGDAWPFEVDLASGRASYVAIEGGRRYDREKYLPDHPVRPLMLDWLVDEGGGMPTNSFANAVISSVHFLDFLIVDGRDGLSAEAFAAFLQWLAHRPGRAGDGLAESTRRRYAGDIRDFLEWASTETEGFTAGELDHVNTRMSAAFRGFGERERRRRQEEGETVSSEDLRCLYRAITCEVEQAEQILEAGPEACEEYDPVLPLLPFPLLLSILAAMRSGELSELKLRDIGWIPEHVHVHQENKRQADLPMAPEVQRVWELARRWQEQYRTNMDVPGAPALVYRERAGGRNGRGEYTGELLRLDALRIRSALSRFYSKYFDARGADGEPILYRVDPETGEVKPFDLPFSKYRHASITEFSRYEKDPSKLRAFARHEWLTTTTDFYVRNRLEEVRDATIQGLGPFSERVRLRVRARRASDEELARAESEDALVPGGACGEALQGIRSCRRATDCRLCKHFLIDPRKREWFVQDSLRRNERADQIEREKGYMREVQNLRGIAAINDAIVQVIDEWEMGLR